MTIKTCKGCNKDLILEESYYKAGAKSYQKLCKACHNATRSKYAPTGYVHKLTGYYTLATPVRKDIEEGLYNKIPCSKLAAKHKVPYSTLAMWKREGKIPEFKPP